MTSSSKEAARSAAALDDGPSPEIVTLKRTDPELAGRIVAPLLKGRSFVLLTCADGRAPPALARPGAAGDPGLSFIVVRGAASATLDAVLAECCRALGGVAEGDRGALHRLVVLALLRRRREGVATILVLENAERLADDALPQLHRLFRL